MSTTFVSNSCLVLWGLLKLTSARGASIAAADAGRISASAASKASATTRALACAGSAVSLRLAAVLVPCDEARLDPVFG
eukprot:CAMPEP_0115647828 /NCGR_PEP_ID=MMETSP0272-20121206/39655_1 /TAXON_ID=71861 /ORGANISM="Scrippsiella trochoidea, Strain CCMP3099" /LENGTH=78 /DNA_ID=CAMNT_0003085415 /DNA_START=61 /DNA_END=294 /DNA_ORIENTATION=+